MNNNKQDREFVSVLGLILWLIDKECNQTSDIFEVCNRVSGTIVNQFIKNKYFNFYRLTIVGSNSSAMDQTRLPSVMLPVSDFLKNIESRKLARIGYRYIDALLEIDAVLAKPLDQKFSISRVDVTPNYHFYSELEEIVRTFRYNLSDVDLIKFYLTSLLHRGGNPFIDKSTLLTLNEFEDISLRATSYSKTVYFPCFTKENDGESLTKQGTNAIAPNDLTVLRNQNLLIENEKLKAQLAEKEQKIKELESLSCKKDTDLLSVIFDEEKTEVYAPDLVNAIKLWQSLYVENKDTEDKHSNRANHWILKNTPYKDIASVEIKRLREITSPFESWHVDRKNKFNK